MTRQLRIAFSTGSMYPGGSERQLLQILTHLDRDRFQPLLYLVYHTGELLEQVPDDVEIASFDTRTHPPRLYWPGRMHGRRIRDMATWLRQQQIDVVYDRTFHMTLTAAPAASRANVPRVSTIVTDPSRDFAQIAGRFRGFKWNLLRQAYLSASQVVSVSGGVARAAEAFYQLPPGSVTTICNAIDLQRLESSSQESPWGAEDGDLFRVVAAGRLHHQKGFDVLIRAASLLVHQHGLHRLRVHILGQGPEEAALRQLIRSERLEDVVRLEGHQNNAAAWFRHSHLFCLSSRYEGMPNTLMEAMACGVPVVSTDCPSGPAEILAAGSYGALVPTDDAAALAAAIGGVHDHYEPMKARTVRARESIQSRFALPGNVRQLEQILEAAAASSAATRQPT